MSVYSFSIGLGDGSNKVTDYYVGDKDDTTYITLTDGGNLSNVTISRFGFHSAIEPGEGPGGDDEVTMDLSGFNDTFNMSVASMDFGDTIYINHALSWSNIGNVYTINYIGSDGLAHTLTIDVESQNGKGIASVVITCFASGTLIETADGMVAVEDLNLGDLVCCGDGEAHSIRWLSKRYVSEAEMNLHPEFRPIRISRDALGENLPNADLCVSPQHRVLLNDWRAELLFGEAEVLVAACHLVEGDRICRDYQAQEVTYYHFMFDRHQTVCSNGLQTESFFPGDTAIEGISAAARDELYQLFPELQADPATYGQTRHPTVNAHEAMALLGA